MKEFSCSRIDRSFPGVNLEQNGINGTKNDIEIRALSSQLCVISFKIQPDFNHFPVFEVGR